MGINLADSARSIPSTVSRGDLWRTTVLFDELNCRAGPTSTHMFGDDTELVDVALGHLDLSEVLSGTTILLGDTKHIARIQSAAA